MPRVGACVVAASVASVALAAEAAPALRRFPTAQTALAFCRRLADPPSLAHASSTARAAPPRARPFVSPHWPLMMAPVCLVCQDDGRTALMAASVLGYEGCVRLLLDSEATEVNATSVSLERALTQAHAIGQLQCSDPLVSCLLSSEPRTVSSAWRGNQRPPRDRQASPRTRRGSDATRQGR